MPADYPEFSEGEMWPAQARRQLMAQAKAAVIQMRKHVLSLDMTITEEQYQFYCRRLEGWRPICPKRARKLRRRGDHVRYLPEFGSNAWQPPHLKGARR